MPCVIEVEATVGEVPPYSALRIFHLGCGIGRAKIHRNPATAEHKLRCDCGFEVAFKGEGGLAQIRRTAITGEQTTLVSEEYFQNGCDSIVVNQRNVAGDKSST